MAWTVLASSVGVSIDGGYTATCPPFDTRGADFFLIVLCQLRFAAGLQPRDQEGDTPSSGYSLNEWHAVNEGWAVPFAVGPGSDFYMQTLNAWISVSPETRAEHSFTFMRDSSPVVLAPGFIILACKGSSTEVFLGQPWPYDHSGDESEKTISSFVPESGTSSYTSCQPTAPITPFQDGCMAVAILGNYFNFSASPITIDQGFTIYQQKPSTDTGHSKGLALAVKIQTTAEEIQPTFSWPDNDWGVMAVMVFRSDGSPPDEESEGGGSCCEDPVVVDPTVVTLLSRRDLRVAHLVKFDFLSTPKYLWNGNRDLLVGSNLYRGLRKLGGIEGLEEQADLTASQLKFTLSGVDANVLALAIGEDRAEYVGQLGTISIQFFDADWEPAGDPIARTAGIMDGIEISRARDQDGQSARTLTLTAENIFYGRGVPPAGNYTDRDQQFRSPGDRGLQFVNEVQNTVIQVPW